MKSRIRFVDLKEMDNLGHSEFSDYNVILQLRNSIIIDTNKSLKEFVKELKERLCMNDYDVVNFNFGNLIADSCYEVSSYNVNNNENKIILTCVKSGLNKEILDLIKYINFFKNNNGSIDSLVDELYTFAEGYEVDEDLSLSDLLNDFEEEISNMR